MADSAKPSCSACGGVINSTTSTESSAMPAGQQLCGGCASNIGCGCGCKDQNCSGDCGCGVSACQEDHTQVVNNASFQATVKVTNSLNFPAVGESASLTLHGVTAMLPGTVLWNQSIGFLHVQSFDAATGIAIAQNKGDAGNVKSAGDLIPECTEFVVGVPATSTSTSSASSDVYPHLSADFTGPANGDCQLASVTNINGITVNDIVSLNSYQYSVKSIPSATTIELCNDGDGAPTGQVIEHDANCDNIEDVQVIVISGDNPCARDGVQTGVILLCDGGVSKPFEGTIDGQVAVWDGTTEKWVLVNANMVEECTALTVCAVFNTGDLGPYAIVVTSTALFTVGDTIVIGEGSAAVTATVTSIVDSTHMTVTLLVAPTAILEFEVPGRVCVADCCSDFQELVTRVTNLETTVDDPTEGVDQINDELDATIRGDCYPSQLAQMQNPVDWNGEQSNWQPDETGPGGNRRRHYPAGDAHLASAPMPDMTIGPFECDVSGVVLITGDLTMFTGSSTGANGMQDNEGAQLHELMLSVAGDVASETPKQFGYSQAGGHFSDTMDNTAGQPAPTEFRTDSRVRTRENFSFHKAFTLLAGNTITASLLHRLSLNGAIQQINWDNADNRFDWKITGQTTMLAWRT